MFKKSLIDKAQIHKTKIAKIQKVLDEHIQSIKVYDETWGNYIFEMNNKWIFKFPRRKESIKWFEKERKILKKFSQISPIPVPDICFEDKDFFGYKKIEGKPFSRKIFDTLNEIQKEKIAEQFASFLDVLHNFEFEKIEKHEFDFKEFKEVILPAIIPKLSKLTQKNALRFFNNFYTNPRNQKFRNTLIHADLRETNIFFDTDKNIISGIIDFGDASMGDIAYDYGKFWFVYGNDLFQKILNHSTGIFDKNFLKRAEFHKKAQPFGIAYCNQERQRWDDVKQAIDQIDDILLHEEEKNFTVDTLKKLWKFNDLKHE